MDVPNYVSPLDVVQAVSLYSCLNLLSDFLYTKSEIGDDTALQRIPVVNGIYDYLDRHQYSHRSKMELVRTVLQGSDLYGEEKDENLDENYATSILNHIVEAFVFDNFISVQGFLVDVMRRTKSYDTWNIVYMAELTLRNTSFENEYGPDSHLSNCSVTNIVKTFIEPMFFTFDKHHHIFSIDYIYAQAGLTFLRSNFLNERNIFYENIYNVNNVSHMNILFHQCIGAALGIEQAVFAGELNETAMEIFSFSALSYYVYKTSHFIEHFNWVNVQDIITNPETWGDIYRTFFDFIDDKINHVIKALDEDHRLQFFSALAAYQNYTSLARDLIEKHCLNKTEEFIQNKITEYKNNPTAFSCNDNNDTSKLPNLRQRFTNQNTNIKTLYFNYEKFLINETYDLSFKNLINYSRVLITLEIPVQDEKEEDKEEYQNNRRNLTFYKPEPDYLKLKYPNSKVEYCILNRTDFKIDLYEESRHPELFEGIKERSAGVAIVKYAEESFDQFVENLANRKATELFKKLDTIESDEEETNYDWLIDVLFAIKPVYTCIHDIKDPNVKSPFSCLYDAIFSIPGRFAVGKYVYQLKSLTTRNAFNVAGVSLRTVSIRRSLQQATEIRAHPFRNEFSQITQIYAQNLFRKTGIELLRLIDSGFELTYTLGSNAIRVIGKFFKFVEKIGRYPFSFFFRALNRAEKKLLIASKRTKDSIGSLPIYISMISGMDHFMFGYKFVYYLEKVGIIRLIPGTSAKMPVFKRDNYYQALNLAEQIYLEDKFLLDRSTLRSDKAKTSTSIERIYTNYEVEKKFLNQAKLAKQTEATKDVQDKNLLKLFDKKFKRYNFPAEGEYEKQFVRAWLEKDDGKIKDSFDKYKIAKPDIFYNLKYGLKMDDAGLNETVLESRIRSVYSSFELSTLESVFKLDDIIQAYKKFNQHFLLKFEDFVAIRSFLSFGSQNISTSLEWTRRMKYAMYRLAIRQYDDPLDDFLPIVYRWEIRTTEFVNLLFNKINHIYKLPRFTLVSKEIPVNPVFLHGKPITKVLYRMNFREKYLRVSIEELHFDDNDDLILLPGTLFTIKNVQMAYTPLEGPHTLVDLDCEYDLEYKGKWENEVMKEIKHLTDSYTVYYSD